MAEPRADRDWLLETGLAVVILSYGSGNQQAELVESLMCEGLASSRILIVHNPDGTAGGARPSARADVLVHTLSANEGYGAGMNRGIAHWLSRDAKWILLLTHDARPEPGSVSTLMEAAARHPSYGVLGPVLVEDSTGKAYSYGGIDNRNNIIGHRQQRPRSVDGVAACAWVDGSVMLLRAETCRQAGPIESRFFMYFEEADFCLRARRSGLRTGVVLGASALAAPSRSKRPLAYGYLFCRNGLLYAWRAGGARRVALAVASQLRMSWWLASKPYNRLFYDSQFRRFGWTLAVGIWLGLIGAAVGHGGPPPAFIQRLSDIGGT